MGTVEKREWANGCQRKRPGGLFWRMRAAISGVAGCKDFNVLEKRKNKKKKRTMKQLPQRQQRLSKFQYDPWSYALNFDEGNDGNCLGSHGGGGDWDDANDVVLIYVVWVRTK
ncbi:hypothetical protein MLD38_021130 [Melastoma candidum]|uniref:Uncharacterized protein n=1 Tax=Melastoma candidum TaxID=119954 RepID=A0ACB9QGY5_9MYRT|nr:hypothetical protein MLD38_021130 [Melastoma candidum]